MLPVQDEQGIRKSLHAESKNDGKGGCRGFTTQPNGNRQHTSAYQQRDSTFSKQPSHGRLQSLMGTFMAMGMHNFARMSVLKAVL
jgi:hypothetical protein